MAPIIDRQVKSQNTHFPNQRKASSRLTSAGGRKFPYHPKVKEIRFFQKIGFLSGLDISALLH